MKIISWNVNGIRSILKKGFVEFIQKEKPDILCIQETKATPDQVQIDLVQYPYQIWDSAKRKGYAGTAIFSTISPLSVQKGIGIAKHDSEGRVITFELERAYLVNVYVPNAQRGLERLDYRTKEWDKDFLAYLKSLEKVKPVIACGDFNVAHKEIDLANPKANVGNAGFTPEERAGFDNIINAGFIDTFREFTKEGGHYTWWSFMGRAREKNIGWRIDYFLISPALRPVLKNSYILPKVMGSDHAPIVLEIAL
ncbi:MAG: exodeoxyribonuclease III [Spirochaetes bacterium]|nr:exodeoxyribonuclease III [Spirochaetota bacterium]